MPTSARYHALQWFLDHETFGPDSVIRRRAPTTRMRRLMLKEGELTNEPVGQFKYYKWMLTPKGREALAAKPPKRRSRRMPDADRAERTEGGERST
jgi:hypothetical protein